MLWTYFMSWVGWGHVVWLFYWSLCWHVAAVRVVRWQALGQGCDYETLSPSWELRTWWQLSSHWVVLGYTALLVAQQSFAGHKIGMRYLGVGCPSIHLLPPVGRWLASWLARSQQARSGHEPSGRPGWARGVMLLHRGGQTKIVSGWLLRCL